VPYSWVSHKIFSSESIKNYLFIFLNASAKPKVNEFW